VRILFANKYLHAKGGSETHLLALAESLSECGHAIEFFGMEDPENVTPPERTVTVPGTSYSDISGWSGRIRAFRDMLFSRPAYERVLGHASRFFPEVAHLHNIYHQLSPSVLVALRDAGVPCVLTAHDYKLVCPSYSLHDGAEQCFACRGHRYWNVLARGCGRKGLAGDLALTIEAYLHHFLRVYKKNLELVIAPSRFVRDRLVEGGYTPRQIRVLPNALSLTDFHTPIGSGDYLLFVGRLSHEKGLQTLLDAARCAPEVPVWIVGDGPLRSVLEQQAFDLNNVRFLGRQNAQQVRSLLNSCRALVLPSHVPENCPLSVLEAFASGRPAIATRVGGIPELFEGPPVGITVPPRDPEALASAMRQFWHDTDLCWHCGLHARRRAESHHDLNTYVTRIEDAYRFAIQRSQSTDPESAELQGSSDSASAGVLPLALDQRQGA
jgi:glycosyltransferase involved in cell wall biosynthesis